MVEEAFAQPELRRLFPYLSLDTRLKFSATTEYPYSERYPYLLTSIPTTSWTVPRSNCATESSVPSVAVTWPS
jgi:hypothetical protein